MRSPSAQIQEGKAVSWSSSCVPITCQFCARDASDCLTRREHPERITGTILVFKSYAVSTFRVVGMVACRHPAGTKPGPYLRLSQASQNSVAGWVSFL